jgi:hypothetical protein
MANQHSMSKTHRPPKQPTAVSQSSRTHQGEIPLCSFLRLNGIGRNQLEIDLISANELDTDSIHINMMGWNNFA